MKRNVLGLAMGGSLLLATTWAAPAATVSLSASPNPIAVGGNTTVDVKVSGLNPGGLPTLTGFNFDLLYNDAVLNATSITFAGALGGGTLTSSDVTTFANSVFASELYMGSFGSVGALEAFQTPEPFTLFSITFNAIAPGLSAISETPEASNSLVVYDGDFETAITDYGFQPVTITVTGEVPPQPVPEGSTLLAVAAVGAMGARTVWRRMKAEKA